MYGNTDQVVDYTPITFQHELAHLNRIEERISRFLVFLVQTQ